MSESTTKAFIKGPEPKKWPKLFEVGHSGAANPERLVRSIIWQRRGLFAITTTVEILAFFGVLLIPFVIGEILDSGIEQGLSLKLLPGFLGLAGLIILRSAIGTSDILRITLWSHTKITLGKQIVRKTFGVRGIGKEKIPSGELVSAFNSDLDRIADLVTQLPGIIAAMLSLSVAGVLIFNISAKLGFLIMIGMPVVLLILMLLMKPLQARFSDYRDARGELATLTTDAVVGLRILRGVGGEAVYNESYKGKSEKVRDAGIRAARVQSLVSALNAGVPAVFSAVVVSFAFLEFYKEAITAGQLLQIYGYTAFLSAPMNMSFFFLFSLADARVGITRVQKMLGVTPLNTDDDARIKKAAEQYEELSWGTADLIDVRSGAVLEAGKQTAIVAQSPVAAASLAKRFARMDDDEAVILRSNGSEFDLRDVPIESLRENLVYSGAIAHLFQGRLRSNLAGKFADKPAPRNLIEQVRDNVDAGSVAHRQHELNPDTPSKDRLESVVYIANAEDVAHMGEGYEQYIAERGRSLSGGQRQRLALARAVLTDAEVLVLVEPTSAVDSHTERRISERLSAARMNRTTAIVTSSPIILGNCDRVILLDAEGNMIMQGTEKEVAQHPQYREIVHRDFAPENSAAGGQS